MAHKDLRLEPYRVQPKHARIHQVLIYEVNEGLDVLVEPIVGPVYSFVIPWRDVRNSLGRKDK